MTTDRTGQVAIVTGGSQGIGRAITEGLLGTGATVVVLGRDATAIAERLDDVRRMHGSDRVDPVEVSLTDEAAAADAVRSAAERHGRLDVLVNNAGVSPRRQVPLEETTTSEWHAMLDVNLTGLYVTCRTALPFLRERNGYIVNVLSLAAHRVKPMSGLYAATKHGARALTEALIEETRGTGVRVSSVSPGPVATGVWDLQENPPGDEARRRMLRPRDVADAVLWLLDRPSHVHVPDIRVTLWPGLD